MKIICKQCSAPNELGHIFCKECGGKLDLSTVTEQLEEEAQAGKRSSVLRFFWIVPMVILVVVAGLCLWPYKPLTFKEDSPGNARKVETTISVFARVAKATAGSIQSLPAIQQKDLNVWLAEASARKVGGASVTVKMEKGEATVRILRTVGPIDLMGYVTIPKTPFSFELTIEPEGGRLNVARGKLGHLPMVGPMKDIVRTMADDVFAGMKREREVFAKLTKIEVDEGQAIFSIDRE